MSSAGVTGARWLFGPVPDLLFGCGLAYMLLFLAFTAGGAALREAQPVWLFSFIVLALSIPHYGATLVRAYESRADRHAYALFTVGATLLVVAAFLAGVRWAAFGAILFTVYLTWSPWHYTGQNYGIGLMFLGRQGVAVEPWIKRWIHASFVLSFVLSALVMHGASGAEASVPVTYVAAQGSPVSFRSLGLPRAFTAWAVPAVGLAYATALGVCAFALLRRARARSLVPFALLVANQALWFSLPFAAQYWGIATAFDPVDPRFATHYGLWIAVAHATQYLWITSYYARTGGAEGKLLFYGKALAAGSSVFVVPWLLVAPGALGRVSASDGLLAPAGASAFILSAAINIHHFILDGAIWKLRNQRVARVLIRATSRGEGEAARSPALRALVWSVCGAALLASAVYTLDSFVLFPAAMKRGDHASAGSVVSRLAFLGQDRVDQRVELAEAYAREGRADLALEQYQRAAALWPQPLTHLRIGQLRAATGAWDAALAAYEEGLALKPNFVPLLRAAAEASSRLGRQQQARAFLERGLAVDPRNARLQRALQRVRAADGAGPAG
jgi:tetratricopeptide (TPR) repeat protein